MENELVQFLHGLSYEKKLEALRILIQIPGVVDLLRQYFQLVEPS